MHTQAEGPPTLVTLYHWSFRPLPLFPLSTPSFHPLFLSSYSSASLCIVDVNVRIRSK